MARKFVLLHSPLVGPFTWQLVADALRAAGHEAVVLDLRPARGDVSAIAGLVGNGVATSDPVVLAAHSGAGVAMPAAAAAVTTAAACLYVDAQLPRPGQPLDSPFYEHLQEMVGPDGLLPPFPSWWGDDVLAELLPDDAIRRRFADECEPVPLAAYAAPAPAIELTPPSAYLRLSEAYDDGAARARADGWPVLSLDLHHLATITHPDPIAAAMLELSCAAD